MTATAVDMSQVLPILLPLVWAAILALGVFLYVLLGGYDLGLGVLFPIAPSDRDRDAMMASVAPFWDGNETWLVLGGGGLLAAFPLAYSVMLPALYIPVILMLLGLILRGVAFEFRFKATRHRWAWDLAFAGGSTVAALVQGGTIGAFVQGFAVTNNQFSGGPFDWLTPFSVVTAIAVLSGYVLLSAGWLIMKADEALREWAYGVARWALIAVTFFIVVFSIWTPLLHPEYRRALVLAGQHHHVLPRAAADRALRRRLVVGHQGAPALRAVPVGHGDLPALLYRARDKPVPLHHPAGHHRVAGRRRARIPALHAVWRDPLAAHHPGLHGVLLLRPVGSALERRLPLGHRLTTCRRDPSARAAA